jgi:hypothetical protein
MMMGDCFQGNIAHNFDSFNHCALMAHTVCNRPD